jgi:hypothetical protein
MQLSLREAAALLGRSARTLRAQVARGEIQGEKKGGRWTVSRWALPMTEAQRRTLLARADEVRATVDAALPSRTAPHVTKKRRSVADLDCFRAAIDLRRALAAADQGEAGFGSLASARVALESGLIELCRAAYAYERAAKVAHLRAARSELSACVGLRHAVGEADALGRMLGGWRRDARERVLERAREDGRRRRRERIAAGPNDPRETGAGARLAPAASCAAAPTGTTPTGAVPPTGTGTTPGTGTTTSASAWPCPPLEPEAPGERERPRAALEASGAPRAGSSPGAGPTGSSDGASPFR